MVNKPTHLISAKLTREAFEIYSRFRKIRRGGHMISDAILFMENERDGRTSRLIAGLEQDIRNLEKNIAALQAHITAAFQDADEANEQVRELFTPERPPKQPKN